MSKNMNAAQAGAAMPSNEPQPLDLHALYCLMTECGYDQDLTLRPYAVQSITARLRGIKAITAVLTAAIDTESLHLGDWLRGGLIEAIGALASDAHLHIERANGQAKKEGAA